MSEVGVFDRTSGVENFGDGHVGTPPSQLVDQTLDPCPQRVPVASRWGVGFGRVADGAWHEVRVAERWASRARS